MIHVEPQPEPDEFDRLVRQPGTTFLASCPHPTQEEWRKHDLWTKVLDQLHEVYGGICAYSCHWISHDTGARTVEHFLSKSVHPDTAYEWSNYRLVCSRLNSRKGVQTILDPFDVETGWFCLDFPSLLVKASTLISKALSAQVEHTCNVLKLNDLNTCRKSRQRYVDGYCREKFTFDFLREEAPFIAYELERQQLVEDIKAMWET